MAGLFDVSKEIILVTGCALTSPLPLWERVDAIAQSSRTGEGSASTDCLGIETPHPALRATFSHKGRRKKAHHYARISALIMSAAFSPIMMVGALVLPPIRVGITEASTTRRPSSPCTFSFASTTAIASLPILAVPTG